MFQDSLHVHAPLLQLEKCITSASSVSLNKVLMSDFNDVPDILRHRHTAHATRTAQMRTFPAWDSSLAFFFPSAALIAAVWSACFLVVRSDGRPTLWLCAFSRPLLCGVGVGVRVLRCLTAVWSREVQVTGMRSFSVLISIEGNSYELCLQRTPWEIVIWDRRVAAA